MVDTVQMARLADIVIDCAHPAALVRLTALGATVLSDHPIADLVVMRDPEGNEFCVVG